MLVKLEISSTYIAKFFSTPKVGSVKEFYCAYQTEYVEKKKFVPPIVHWLSSIGRSRSTLGQ